MTEDMQVKNVGERVKALREGLGLTQPVFADKIGRKRSTIANIECGILKLSNTIRLSICNVFGVHEEWLLTGEGEKYIVRGTARAENDAIKEASAPAGSGGPIYNNDAPPASARATPSSGSASSAGNFSIAEDLMLAAKVLESRTHYAMALHLNIRSFAADVEDTSVCKQLNDVQARLGDLEGKIDSLQQENKTLRTEVNRLEATYENPGEGNNNLTNSA